MGCTRANCCGGTPTATPEVENGIRVFSVRDPRGGIVVVEGFTRTGSNVPPVGQTLVVDDPAQRPDLQIESNRPLGNGSKAVCDHGPGGGGVPGIPTPSFDEGDQTSFCGSPTCITKALQDAACRFTIQQPSTACTRDPFGNPGVVNSSTSVQFCNVVDTIEQFQPGDTLLTVQLRDDPAPSGPGGPPGQFGPTAQIIVRVLPTPTPNP